MSYTTNIDSIGKLSNHEKELDNNHRLEERKTLRIKKKSILIICVRSDFRIHLHHENSMSNIFEIEGGINT